MDGQDYSWGWRHAQAYVNPVGGDDDGRVLFILVTGGGGISGVTDYL